MTTGPGDVNAIHQKLIQYSHCVYIIFHILFTRVIIASVRLRNGILTNLLVISDIDFIICTVFSLDPHLTLAEATLPGVHKKTNLSNWRSKGVPCDHGSV